MPDRIIALNIPQVAGALEKAAEALRPGLQRATRKWLLRRVGELARYPSPPPGSTYRRTGTLGRTWTSAQPTWAASSSGFEASLGNATPYGIWVQGDPGKKPGQAKIHQDRWGVASKIAEDAEAELEADIRTEVAAVEAQLNRVTA